jgi:hypothetical protein
MDSLFEVSMSTLAMRREDVLSAKVRVLSNLIYSPEIASLLELTSQQQVTIRNLVRRRLRLVADESESHESKNTLIDRTTTEILAGMTNEQQRKFLTLQLDQEGPRLLASRMRALDALAYSPDLLASLKLSDSARQSIVQAVQPILSQLADSELPLPAQESLVDEAYAQVLAKMTPSQQQHFLEMKFP